MKTIKIVLMLLFVLGMSPSRAAAEVDELNFATLYGVSTLPVIVMQRNRLVEKHAAAAGIKDLKINWRVVGGSSLLNDGLIGGKLQFIGVGITPLITLWDKTQGANQVKGVAAMTTYPLYLNVRNPQVRSIADFSARDKIALPSIKVSTQAIMLQMAAAKAFGPENYARLDPLTVSLSHPDGQTALVNRVNGVTAHFTVSPYHEQEIKLPDVRTLMTSYDILGGPGTANLLVTTSKFREDNPKLYKAVYDALREAIAFINEDKLRAAKIYLDFTKDTSMTAQAIDAMISAPDYFYEMTPRKVGETARFMQQIGAIRHSPASWQDLFFPEAHALPGD